MFVTLNDHRRLGALLLVLLLGAASLASAETTPTGPPPPDSSGVDPKAEWEAWTQRVKTERQPAELFPSAATVRAYGGQESLVVGPHDAILTYRLEPSGSSTKVPAKGGEKLTDAEIATLRGSVFFAPPPPAIAMCCIPRHGFTFYDRGGHLLGLLRVCFQCGCAQIDPSPPHDPALNEIVWDRAAIRTILEAHHLSVAPSR